MTTPQPSFGGPLAVRDAHACPVATVAPRVQIIQGDALSVLRTLPSESVQCVVTSPPYLGLRSYGTNPQTWGGDPDHAHEWGTVASPGARTNDEKPGLLQHAGNKGRERLSSALCACGAWRGELGLEPTPALFIEHLVTIFREVKRVLRSDGLCFVNIGDSYHNARTGGMPGQTVHCGEQRTKPTDQPGHRRPIEGIPQKSLMLIPQRFAIAMQDDGWIVRSCVIWSKTSAMPESVKDRPTSAWEPIWMFAKSQRYYWDQEAVRQESKSVWNSAKGFNEAGQSARNIEGRLGTREDREQSGANIRNVWSLSPEPQGSLTWHERVCVSPDDADDDTERTTSPDCPVHGNHPAPTSLDGGPQGDLRLSTPRNGTGHVQEPLGERAPTPAPSSEAWGPVSSDGPAATLHSTPESRTAPHVETSPACSAFEETCLSTDGTSVRHGSGMLRPDMGASSKASGDSGDAPDPRSPAGTDGSALSGAAALASTGLHDAVSMTPSSIFVGDSRGGPSVRTPSNSTDKLSCTCSYSKVIIRESAHFAQFPSEIPRRCIKAGSRVGDIVLDPFLGSGTTALVADQLGRRALGIELSPTYCDLARRRIDNDAGPLLSEPVQVVQAVQPSMFDAPAPPPAAEGREL